VLWAPVIILGGCIVGKRSIIIKKEEDWERIKRERNLMADECWEPEVTLGALLRQLDPCV
jgi:hypothetical protein